MTEHRKQPDFELGFKLGEVPCEDIAGRHFPVVENRGVFSFATANAEGLTTIMARAEGLSISVFRDLWLKHQLTARAACVIAAGRPVRSQIGDLELVREMLDRGCGACVMEVSSHSLALHRVHGLRFRAGVFTNLTQDHLDFHGSMDAYFTAKKRLFDMLEPDACAVVNADDPRGRAVAAETRARVLTYGVRTPADVTARGVQMDVRGLRMQVTVPGGSYDIRSRLTGAFNVENILAACATAAPATASS